MVAWPASIPQQFDRDSFSMDFPDGSIRSEVDSGPDFARQRFTATPEPFSGTLVLTETQLATLKAFYADTLGHGVDVFDWTHPITGDPVSVQFTSAPSLKSFSAGVYRARVSFEVLP